jgi:gluconolactonase
MADATKDPGSGNPDGMKLDSQGNIYSAGPGGLWVFSPAGKHLGTIKVPEIVSNCAWGDDGKTLYIMARTSVYRIKLSVPGQKVLYEPNFQ